MPKKIPAKIFIDGGVVEETRQAKEMLGYLDGQTTNPSLIAKNLASRSGGKLSADEALGEYKRIIREIHTIIPHGSISIQVFADKNTKSSEMLQQARDRISWIPNGSIKLPCTTEGLKAAQTACQEMPINITLCFSQSQAAAVYEATRQAKYPVFISPFVGRLDDRGENGMQAVENILKMYNPPDGQGDGHVEVLTASVRSLDHILYALQLQSQIITIPFKILTEWVSSGLKTPDEHYTFHPGNLKPIPYREDISLGKPWQEYDLHHDLTDTGIEKFWSDWMGIVK